MENNGYGDDSNSIDWDTDDELEISNAPPTGIHFPTPTIGVGVPNGEVNGESSSARSADMKLILHFVGMGFPDKLVVRAIEELGKESSESTIIDAILTYMALENDNEVQKSDEPKWNSESSSDYLENPLYDLSDSENPLYYLSDSDISSDEGVRNPMTSEEKKIHELKKMGYSAEEVQIAMERCPEASIAVLADFIFAAQMAREETASLPAEVDKPKMNFRIENGKLNRRGHYSEYHKSKKVKVMEEQTQMIRLPKPMIGFGVPSSDFHVTERTLPEQALGPPYFYYENVALTPQGVWDQISRFLYDIEPEFVDSKYFCAAARKRGYIHNLPIKNRFELLPTLPLTIHEAFPLTKRWWPAWDKRTHLNCLQTAIGSAQLQNRIRKLVEEYDGVEPPEHVKKEVLFQCRKWNLLWVGRNKVAPLEPDEFEVLLGFPKNHTRGGGTSRTERFKCLGNSFQVNTVAYHLSVLKPLYPNGIRVLSLFSGIGGGEVALHRLGVPLNYVVSVEKSEVNRDIMRSWWEQTNQTGTLEHYDDVQALDADKLERLVNKVGGFDLVIGGSPCNNLAGSNRVSRDGLEGKESSLFYDYFRILDAVRAIMRRRELG